MRGVEHAHALGAQAADELEDVEARLRVDAHSGLVEQDEFRAVEKGAAEIHAALHAAGEGLHGVLGAIGERERGKQLGGAGAGGLRVEAGEASPEFEVLGGAQLLVEREFLRHDAHDTLGRLRVGGERLAGDGDAATVGLEQAADHRDGGGLAGAVWAEQAVDLARAHGEAHIGDGLDGAEGLGEVLDLEQGCHGGETAGGGPRSRADGSHGGPVESHGAGWG